MKGWLIPAAGVALAVAAAGTGVGTWASTGGRGSCDRVTLERAMSEGMRRAESAGATRFMPEAVGRCSDEDMLAVVPSLTLEWHVMPGGMMMRSPEHAAQ